VIFKRDETLDLDLEDGSTQNSRVGSLRHWERCVMRVVSRAFKDGYGF